MSATLAQVTRDVFALPNHQRLTLAGMILQADDGEPSPVEQAWDTEICRRVAAIKNGTAKTIPYEEVMAEMDELLSQ